jgi:hypothetical protein
MFSLTIVFGDSPTASWAFTYREEATATMAEAIATRAIENPKSGCVIVDDFGQNAAFAAGTVKARNLEDLDQTGIAAAEREIVRMKGYAAMGEKIDKTPELTTALNKARRAMQASQMMGGGGPFPGPRP